MRCRVLECTLVVLLVAGMSGCGTTSEQGASVRQVPLSAVPEPARLVIETLIMEGEIKKIEKEEVDGQVIYDVEASVGGKDVEYDVASDGTVLTAEESVSYASLPAAVQVAAQRYYGSATELKASREVEQGKTFYEVEGQKKGKAVALKLTDAGHIVEEERQ